ncbi:MAG: hypothetical protein PHR35_19895 [Kiritimatiellae bacterium]|jgi:hypothetical protein|nr:hypothetical protein [Kiritimatiellia bacterium]
MGIIDDWRDAVDHKPGVQCEVELSSGERLLARYVGGWETLDGRVISPVRWRFKNLEVLTPTYKLPAWYAEADEDEVDHGRQKP